jgi:thiamine-phosphate pyrophosphorylase
MQFNKCYQENFYFFTTYINEQIIKNVVKFKNIAIIYNNKYIINENNFLEIKNFCKINNIKFFIVDNLRLAIKYNLDGLIISHNNKRTYLNVNNYKKNFKIIGKAHSQNEYFFKIKQNCTAVLLSPIFQNLKYNTSKILTINKFNQMSKNWKIDVYALGGINFENIKKIKMTKAKGVGFISLISNLKIKKPALFFK